MSMYQPALPPEETEASGLWARLIAPRPWQRKTYRFLIYILRDRYLWALIIVALIMNLGLFAYLILEFTRVPPTLPPLVPLHFDANGDPDRIVPRNSLFSLAQIGLIVIVGNLALGGLMYRRERLATYLLAASAIVIQFLLWFAAIQILRAAAL